MSNFQCSQCGTALIDSPTGYVTGCEHHPIEKPMAKSGIDQMVERLQGRRKSLLRRLKNGKSSLENVLDCESMLRENRSALDMALVCQSVERANAKPGN